MQQLVGIEELKSRAERIGLSLRKLAIRAGVSPSTPYRWLTRDRLAEARAKKLRAMQTELEAEERRVAEHLLTTGGLADKPEAA